MKELLNKIIVKVELSEDRETFCFTDADGIRYFYNAYGDCCSSSWFSNITGIKNLLGQKIISVIDREEFTDEEQKEAEAEYAKENDYGPESLALYGIILKTDKGSCDVEFRNESNGYYGGDCSFGGHEQITEGLKNITKDF